MYFGEREARRTIHEQPDKKWLLASRKGTRTGKSEVRGKCLGFIEKKACRHVLAKKLLGEIN